jgi:TonB family protein
MSRPVKRVTLPVADPFARARAEKKSAAAKLVLVISGAIATHVLAMLVIVAVSAVAAKLGLAREDEEELLVAIVEAPPPELPKVPELPELPEEPEREPPEVVPKKAPPPPDPTDLPEEEPEQDHPPPVVGLDVASTVPGEGPAFAIGNTRMGDTATIAADPELVEELPKTLAPPPAKVIAPKRTRLVEPYYPMQYRRASIEDSVLVALTVGSNGMPNKLEIVQPSKYPLFNSSIRRAMMQDEYEPATVDGIPVEYTLNIRYNFRLHDERLRRL